MISGFDYTIDGDRLEGDFPMDRRALLHSAALALYNAEPSFGLTSLVSVRSHNPFEGAGTVNAQQVLEWVLSDEGRESLKREPMNMLPYLEKLAKDKLGGA